MDCELVDRARRGDEEAYEPLIDAVFDRCFGVARRILGETPAAQDATQQALFDIWRKLPGLRDVHRFEAWCYRIVVNACYAEARKSKRSIPGLLPDDHELAATADDIGSVIDRDQVQRAFERQRIEHRAVLVLRYYLDLPLEEIAAVLDIPLGTVKSRIHNGLRAMRAAIEADSRSPTGGEPILNQFSVSTTTRWLS